MPEYTPAKIPIDSDPDVYEQQHVHDVYDSIAPHFSQTRYKPWPVVDHFIRSLPSGSVGADIGCGNGKYLGLRTLGDGIFTIGNDRSSRLVEIAASRSHEVLVCDGLNTPFKSNAFDFILSIAVIHHFTTFSRRLGAIQEILRILRPGGRFLVFVWALEQSESSRRKFAAQDVFVPWVQANLPDHHPNKTRQRYYHLFAEGELEDLVIQAGGLVIEKGYDKDNWYIMGERPDIREP